MDKISGGSKLSRLSPVRPRLQPRPSSDLPQDEVSLSRKSSAKPQRSAIGKLVRWAGLAGMTASAATSVIGAIAYQANKHALQAPSVHIYPHRAEAPPPPSLTAQLSQPDRVVPRFEAPGPVQLVVPKQTLQQVLDNLKNSAQFEKILADRTQEAERQLQDKVSTLHVPGGQMLLDVNLPLPTSDRPLLQVKGVDLPSGGYRGLTREPVPMALHFSAQPVQTGLQAKVELLPTPAEQQGPGLLLGAVQVTVTAPEGSIPVQGQLRMGLDLNGQATRRQIEQIQGHPGQDALVAQLQQRLGQGERLQQLGQDQGFSGVLGQGFDQEMAFQARVLTGEKPLVKSTFSVWAVPDQNGDGKADIQVTEQTDMTAIGELGVELAQLHSTAGRPQGRLSGIVHDQVQNGLRQGVHGAVPQVTGQLRQLAAHQARAAIEQARPQLQQAANQQLQQLYQKDLHFGQLKGVQVGPEGLRIDLQGTGSARVDPTVTLQPGQAAAAVDMGLLNQHLRDTSEGGSVDWTALLNQARQKSGLLDLQFGRDRHGKLMTPQLSMRNGRLCISAEITAKPKGAEPVRGVTGLAKGATGGMDKGAEQLQRGLKKDGGPVGDLVGTVIRAPFFLVDKAVDGTKFVADNTVGRVVDPLPEVATRPTIHTRVMIPLDLQTRDGALQVKLDPKAVEFKKASSQAPFDLLDVLPTRLLSNVLVNAIAGSAGPAKVGDQVKDKAVGLDLTASAGIHFEAVRVAADGDLTVVFKPTARTGDWLSRK